MSTELETSPEAPSETIYARFHWDGPRICYSARGVAAGSLAELAKLLGVDESRLVPKVEPEDWAAHERWLRRQRGIRVKSGFPW
jgi:hypothetical protein